MRGKFLTLEGIDSAGKSTCAKWLADRIAQSGIRCHCTREPGGTAFGESLREVFLNAEEKPDPLSESLLLFAARREHVVREIAPRIAKGIWVICDRFTDSTFAYQGGGRGAEWDKIAALAKIVHPDLTPDLTLFLDVPFEVSAARSRKRNLNAAAARKSPSASQQPFLTDSPFDRETANFFAAVRRGYLRCAEENPKRICVVNADVPPSKLQREVTAILSRRFGLKKS